MDFVEYIVRSEHFKVIKKRLRKHFDVSLYGSETRIVNEK